MSSRVFSWLLPVSLNILIYSTLSIGPQLINFLNRDILKGGLSAAVNLFLLGAGTTLLLTTIIRFKSREPIRYLWLLAVFLAVFDIIQIPGSPAERIHFLEYAVVSILWWRVLRYYSSSARWIYFATFLITTSFGCIDELIQFFLPNRFYGYDDMIRNASGGALGVIYLGLVERNKHLLRI